jgi:hypothetical protein
MHGNTIPKSWQVDHIDGNPLDNRLSNLRTVSNKVNCQNRGKKSTNTSGKTGVGFMAADGLDYARATWVNTNGKQQSKLFSIARLGIMVAVASAAKFRDNKILELNNSGEAYTERHKA